MNRYLYDKVRQFYTRYVHENGTSCSLDEPTAAAQSNIDTRTDDRRRFTSLSAKVNSEVADTWAHCSSAPACICVPYPSYLLTLAAKKIASAGWVSRPCSHLLGHGKSTSLKNCRAYRRNPKLRTYATRYEICPESWIYGREPTATLSA
jgi:hypothetical protein